MTSDDNQVEAKLTSEALESFSLKLKTCRESMGFTIQDVSLRLHLSPRFIHLLENEDLLHSTLPPIYLRGYLRSYAKLLNIHSSEINAVLEKLAPTPAILTATPAAPEALALSFPLQNNPYFTRLATTFVALLLLTSITTWWFMHNNGSSSTIIAANQPLNNSGSNEAIQLADNTSSAPTPLSTMQDTSPSTNNPSLAPSASLNPTESAQATAPSLPAPTVADASPQLTNSSDHTAATTQSSPKATAKSLEPDEGDEEQD